MKLPKLFRFKHEIFFLFKKFSIVRTPTSVTKMISRKYKFHVLKRKIAQKFFLARSNAKSHHFFIWVVMFILTFFWVRKQYFPFPNTEILLTLEDAFNLQFVG